MSVLVLPPSVKPLKAPHRIPKLESAELPFELGIVSSAKKDGNRGLCVAGQLFTSSMLPPENANLWQLLGNLIDHAATHNLVFDYELYDPEQSHHGATSGVINSYSDALSPTLRCYVFDMASLNDFLACCVDTPYQVRIADYHDAVSKINDDKIVALAQRPCKTVDDVREYFAQDLAAGDEGSMLRALDVQGDAYGTRRYLRGGWYKHGRATPNQSIIWKLKNYITVDGIITAVHPRRVMKPGAPRSVNASGQLLPPPASWYEDTACVGAFEVQYRDGSGNLTSSNVNFGAGFAMFERDLLWQMHEQEQLIGEWCEFKHMPHGARRQGKLRIGQFVRLRPDRRGEAL